MKQFIEKFSKQTNLSTQILVVIGIILVLNFLSYQIFVRFDITENKIYSISDISKNAVKNLDDVVNIKAYFSENLPPQYLAVKQEVRDILEEYQNYANNNLHVEFIDPKDNEDLELELRMLGVPKLQFNVLENDKYEVIGGYLGIVAEFGDKKQGIPVVNNIRNLEYQLTSAIKKVTVEKIPTVAFTTGHDELDKTTEMSIIEKKLGEIYTMRSVDLSTSELVPSDIDTLIIAGPKEIFTEREQYVIDQFIMSGSLDNAMSKSVIFLVDGVNIDESLVARANTATLDRLLTSYGVRVEKYFVLDTSNDMASFNQGFMSFTTPYPFFVKINEKGLDQESASVAKLQNLVFPWVSPITIDLNKNPEATLKTLVMTTPEAWTMKEDFSLQPQGTFGFNEDPEQYSLVVSIMGKINSAFNNYVAKEKETGEHIASTENARIIVIGDSDFAKDTFMQRYPDDLMFLQNIIDSVSLDSDLIQIRSKDVNERPLEKIEDSEKSRIKILNIFGVTAIVVIFGVVRYIRRKKSKFADDL